MKLLLALFCSHGSRRAEEPFLGLKIGVFVPRDVRLAPLGPLLPRVLTYPRLHLVVNSVLDQVRVLHEHGLAQDTLLAVLQRAEFAGANLLYEVLLALVVSEGLQICTFDHLPQQVLDRPRDIAGFWRAGHMPGN